MVYRRRTNSAEGPDSTSVVWITNLAAPYRIPVWKCLQEDVELEVALLESKSSLEADVRANRGLDWIPSDTDEIRVREIPTIKLKHGEARYYFPKQLESVWLPRRHDVVVFGGWESPIYWLLLAVAKFHRRGCVAFYESTLMTMRHRKGLIHWGRRVFFNVMDCVVVPGPAARAAVLSLGVPAHKIFQGFNAVDVVNFKAASPLDYKRQSPGHSFLFVGQLIARKRVPEIIDAFESIATPHDTLTIVGSGYQAGMIKDRILPDNRISVIDYVDNKAMPALMAQQHTLVLASSEEVWGLVVNEALASGMHVVITRACGVVPSVDQMAGVFVTQDDLGDLAKQMARSRSTWTGPIANPEILKYTPEEFAEVFRIAIRQSLAREQTAEGASGATQ